MLQWHRGGLDSSEILVVGKSRQLGCTCAQGGMLSSQLIHVGNDDEYGLEWLYGLIALDIQFGQGEDGLSVSMGLA
ncbi:hypothetical protein PROFUN_16299 [Planoprotostelium fungivorum]|uniref:Uncharacterized protein n=1 Tax=Planoprotostelium fungivorum TaxID=1890364 RepID=A0A2P6MQN0_9EUKA|nr:hypothetical protein PROFUN_16299 [Planoprotostelium fungivorum]